MPQEAAYTYETTATNTESTTVIAEMTTAAVAAVGDETLRRASIAIIIAAPANATLNMPRKNASTEMSATIASPSAKRPEGALSDRLTARRVSRKVTTATRLTITSSINVSRVDSEFRGGLSVL